MMNTPMPFCDELAAAAGSNLVRDMMVVQFQREVAASVADKGELMKKVQEIRARVAARDYVIGELEILYPFDSCVQSILELTKLQTEDLNEAEGILVNVTKKQNRAQELSSFIEKLKGVVY